MNANTPKQCPDCGQPYLGEGPTCGSTPCGKRRSRSITIDEQWLEDNGFKWVEHDRKAGGFELRIGPPGEEWETVFRVLHEPEDEDLWAVEMATATPGEAVDWATSVGCAEPFRLRADLLRLIRLVTFRDWTPGGGS